MSDDEKPSAVDDLKKGLGLLFRAAKTAVDKLPPLTGGKLEDVVMTGAREVGRAVENVAETIDKEIFHKGAKPPPAGAPSGGTEPEPPAEAKAADTKSEPAPAPAAGDDSAPKGPRIG